MLRFYLGYILIDLPRRLLIDTTARFDQVIRSGRLAGFPATHHHNLDMRLFHFVSLIFIIVTHKKDIKNYH